MSYPDWEEIRGSSLARSRNFPMISAEQPTFMARPLATGPADLRGADAVIIGAPYVAGWHEYAGVPKSEWIAAPARVRQQSIRYPTGYVQDFDLDIFEHVNVVDYGDAEIPPEANERPTVANILRAQEAVEQKVSDALEAGAVPIVLGQNSPCGSYAIAKPIAESCQGTVGVISLDTHWDIGPVDELTVDPRIAGANCWKRKMYEFHQNISVPHLVEIGERGMLEESGAVRDFLARGAHFYPMWRVRTGLGIEGLCDELAHAYEGTDAVYVHFDMDILGGAGPAPGDILGELAEPIGMSDYEVIRLAHEIGLRGLTGMSFICIPPGSAVVYRTIVYVIAYLLAGRAISAKGGLSGEI
jgi:agmatinase